MAPPPTFFRLALNSRQLFSRLHCHAPGVVVFEESTKGRLRVYCVQLECMRSDRQRVVDYADTLEPDYRINRRKINGNRRVEEKRGVEVQHVGFVDRRHAINLECDIQRLEDAHIHKRVGWRAVGIVCAKQDPKWQHECLPGVESHVNVTGRAIAGGVGNGHEHDMRRYDGIAVSINWDGETAEHPALINLVPRRSSFSEPMKVSVHPCK